MKEKNSYDTVPLPKTRRAISDMLRQGKRKHMVHGLVEVDVTEPRERIQAILAATGERTSFTAFIIYCLGQAIDENKGVQGYLNWRQQLIVFDDVDVNTQIERQVEERSWVMPYIVRAANRKSLAEIHCEIRTAQVKELSFTREFRQFEWYLRLPAPIRWLFWWILSKSPLWTKRLAGTVGVTSVGMFGSGGGWGIPITTQTLLLTLGGIAEKPALRGDQLQMRQFLSLTVSFDHDIIDGAPAARFTRRLTSLIEAGHGLANV